LISKLPKELPPTPFLSFQASVRLRNLKVVRLLPRLFSTFDRGWSGAGLLLMRLVAGITLVSRGIIVLRGEPQLGSTILHVLSAGAGIFLLAGLWTPIAGVIAAVFELWHIFARHSFAQPGDSLTHVMLATLAIALALVGPGAWSVDARLFGWKRIDIGNPVRNQKK
jgi:putative oxidoreductase